jgi:hypothetical protein
MMGSLEDAATIDGSGEATAASALRSCAMPEAEIHSVLEAADPEIVRRHVELHIERLEERLARQRRILRRVQRTLSGGRFHAPGSGGGVVA